MSLDILNVGTRSIMDRCITALGEDKAWEIFDAVVANEGESREQLVGAMGDENLTMHVAMEWLTYLEQNDLANPDNIGIVHTAQQNAFATIESS